MADTIKFENESRFALRTNSFITKHVHRDVGGGRLLIARLFLAVCAASLILVSSVVAGESPSKPSLAAAFAVPVSRATASVGASPAGAVTIPLYASFAAPAGWGWTANNITEPGPTLTVRQGDVITFQLFSNDTMQHQLIIDLDNSHTNTTGDEFSLPFSSRTTATVFTYTASTVGTFAYFCNIHGYNAQHGQLVVNGPPSAPISLAAAAGNAQVVLTWQAPASNGGSAITSYKVYRGTTAGSETLLTTLGNVLTYTDSAVTNGQTYFYQVTATNALGESAKSSEVSAIPNAPSPPGDNTLLIAGGVIGVVVVVGVAAAAMRMRKKKPGPPSP